MTQLTQSDIDNETMQLTSAAWVIGGTTTLSLPAGQTYTPGNAIATGAPTIWIIGDAVLEIDGHGATPVSLASHIYLCDNATFRVRNATFRNEQDSSYQYWMWAAGSSRVEYENATIETSLPGANAVAFQVLRSNAELLAPGGGAADFDVTSGSLDLAATDSGSIDVDGASGFTSLFAAGSGSVAFANSSYASMSTTTCGGESHMLANVPVACDLDGGGCFGGSHPLTTHDRLAAPSIDIDQSRIFGWSVETFPGSTTQLDTISVDANLSVLLGGDFGNQTLTLVPGMPPVGLTDRVLLLNNAPVSYWSVSASGTSNLTLAPGTELVDLFVTSSSLVTADDIEVNQGTVRIEAGTELRIRDSLVNGPVSNQGGLLQSVGTIFQQSLTLGGTNFVADTSLPINTLTVLPGSLLYEVSLTQPASGPVTPGDTVAIHGSVNLTDPSVLFEEYPPARVELYDETLDTTTVLATISDNVNDQLLATLDTTGLAPGNYEIRLRYDDTTEAVSIRSLSLGAPVPGLPFLGLVVLTLMLGGSATSMLYSRSEGESN